MLPALLLLFLFGLPGFVLLGCERGRGGAPWPWPRGLAVMFAFGMALAGLAAIVLDALREYSLEADLAVAVAATTLIGAANRFRFAWPLSGASFVESAGFLVSSVLAASIFLGHPFEMLLGERDATVYTVSGIALAREGSLVLTDHTAERIGEAAMQRFYPAPAPRRAAEPRLFHLPFFRLPLMVKYPGFYYADAERREIISQG